MPAEPAAYLLLTEGDVPDRWRSRARSFLLVPLLPEEATQFLSGEPPFSTLDPDDERLAALVARGLAVSAISRELRQPLRTVQRRVSRLRKRLGVATTKELAAELARRGFR